jgi:integrase
MERPGLRQWRNQRRAFRRPRNYQSVQDRIVNEADPDGSSPGRVAEGVAGSCAPFPSKDDWVFASKRANGKRPIWGQSIMRKQIHPAIEKLGIGKRIGWHTFRHSCSTLLRHLGTDIKVQQDLLRHSSARLTLDTYTQAVTPAKREAQNAVVKLLLPAESAPRVAPTTNNSYIGA